MSYRVGLHKHFLPYLAAAKNPKIRFVTLTLKFTGFRAVAKEHVPAKFRSGS